MGTMLGVCTLHLLTAKTEPTWVFDRWCGFQVVDRTVAWTLSRVGPAIRRGHRFVSYCTTVVVCIPRLLAVVISLNNYVAPPALHK